MANLYLIDRPYGENALALARQDGNAKVVLVADGIFLDTSALNRAQIKVYAVRQDVQIRSATLPGYIQIIDYGQFIDLINENNVINFA